MDRKKPSIVLAICLMFMTVYALAAPDGGIGGASPPATGSTLVPVPTTLAPAGAKVHPAAAPAQVGAKILSSGTPAVPNALHLTFALASAQVANLAPFVASLYDPQSPNFHQWLTPQQVGQQFGAANADVQAVVAYALAQGFTVTNVWPNRLFISADATVAQVEQAFGVQILQYDRPANTMVKGDPPTFYAPDQNPRVPAAIAARLQGIFGMSDLNRMRPAFSGPLSPAQVSTVYDLDPLHAAGLNGQSMTIGVFSPTNVNLSDVATFASDFSLGTGYTIQEVKVDGGATDSNGAGEANLDMDIIVGQANKITIDLYESPNNGNLDVWNKIETDNLAVISNSWGLNETSLTGQQAYVTSWETILMAMYGQGQAHFNSSGDAGAFDAATGTQKTVSMAGSSPYVTCVGGTALPDDNNGHWLSETAWTYDPTTKSGSGGGLSVLFSQPSWQTGPGVSNTFSNGMRQVPDVAALADLNTPGYLIVSQGQLLQAGGTSASTPLWAVANVLCDQGAGKRLGNLNPALYWLGTHLNDASDIFVFHDITVGNNGFYPCTPKWDFVTGWGSADFYKLYADLNVYQGITTGSPWSAALLPNLLPYNPGGNWTSPIMIHTDPGAVTEPAVFRDSDTYFFAVAVADNGPADTIPNRQSLQIDGVDHKFTLGAFPAGYYLANLQVYSTRLTAGMHTIKLIANVDNTVQETNTHDNVFTRVITVKASGASVALKGLSINPASVFGGQNSTGTVTLSSPAAPGNVIVSLSSSNPAVATVPAAVTVGAGIASQVFQIRTYAVATATTVTVTATYGGNSTTATLTVLPAP